MGLQLDWLYIETVFPLSLPEAEELGAVDVAHEPIEKHDVNGKDVVLWYGVMIRRMPRREHLIVGIDGGAITISVDDFVYAFAEGEWRRFKGGRRPLAGEE